MSDDKPASGLPTYPVGVVVRLVFNGVGGTGITGTIPHVLPEGIVLKQPEPLALSIYTHDQIADVTIEEIATND